MSLAVSAEPSAWQRYLVQPVLAQLRQGISPEKIALTVALGAALTIFPILGATALLCTVAGMIWKLNQPIIHLVNWVFYPLQLVLLIPFYRAGEWLFRKPHVLLSIPLLIEQFRASAIQFLRDFSVIALQGVVVWCLVAPVLAALIYFAVLLPLRRLPRRSVV